MEENLAGAEIEQTGTAEQQAQVPEAPVTPEQGPVQEASAPAVEEAPVETAAAQAQEPEAESKPSEAGAPAAETPVTEEPKPVQEPKWYIVQTLTGMEDRVKAKIENEIQTRGWSGKVFRVLVPEEETEEVKGDKRVVRKRKMYPGYVFVEMIMDEEVWFEIRQTQGVARFIGGKIHPVPVTDREMQRVLKQIGIKEKEVTVEFEVGEPIRIISGSFRGYTGSVSEINAGKSKLKAMINIFGRDTSVEVDFDRVEKII